MTTVGIKELKNTLSAVIKRVEAGETVLVTDRGKIVARITPETTSPDRPQTEAEILAQLVREGIMKPATKQRWKRPPELAGSIPFDELMRDLDADREDR